MAANPIQLSGLARRLVEDNLLEDSVAREAAEEAAKTRVPFVTHLVQNNLANAKDIANSASEEFGTPILDISALDPESIPANLVDEKLVRVNYAMPIFHRGNRLFVAVSDPTNRKGLEDIAFQTGIATEEVLVDPRTSYAMAKRYNEIYLASHHEERGINVISIRFFNVYGWNQDNRMVVPRFFEQCEEEEDITVFGSGEQTRDFTYIEDTIEACCKLIGIKGSHIVNIANESEWCITELASEIKSITNAKSKITYLDAPKKRYDYEVERRVGSSEKLYKLTKYKPDTELREGLQKIYEINYPKAVKN